MVMQNLRAVEKIILNASAGCSILKVYPKPGGSPRREI